MITGASTFSNRFLRNRFFDDALLLAFLFGNAFLQAPLSSQLLVFVPREEDEPLALHR